MAIKKSELYSSLWASCDELRGGMDASQYKDYVLVLLFVFYSSFIVYFGAAFIKVWGEYRGKPMHLKKHVIRYRVEQVAVE